MPVRAARSARKRHPTTENRSRQALAWVDCETSVWPGLALSLPTVITATLYLVNTRAYPSSHDLRSKPNATDLSYEL